jgi:hypothetical protein
VIRVLIVLAVALLMGEHSLYESPGNGPTPMPTRKLASTEARQKKKDTFELLLLLAALFCRGEEARGTVTGSLNVTGRAVLLTGSRRVVIIVITHDARDITVNTEIEEQNNNSVTENDLRRVTPPQPVRRSLLVRDPR